MYKARPLFVQWWSTQSLCLNSSRCQSEDACMCTGRTCSVYSCSLGYFFPPPSSPCLPTPSPSYPFLSLAPPLHCHSSPLLPTEHWTDAEESLQALTVYHCVTQRRHVQQCQCGLPHQVCGWRLYSDQTRQPKGSTPVWGLSSKDYYSQEVNSSSTPPSQKVKERHSSFHLITTWVSVWQYRCKHC